MNVGNGVQIPYESSSIYQYTLYPKKLLLCYFLVMFHEMRSMWSYICMMYNVCNNSVKHFQYNKVYWSFAKVSSKHSPCFSSRRS